MELRKSEFNSTNRPIELSTDHVNYDFPLQVLSFHFPQGDADSSSTPYQQPFAEAFAMFDKLLYVYILFSDEP